MPKLNSTEAQLAGFNESNFQTNAQSAGFALNNQKQAQSTDDLKQKSQFNAQSQAQPKGLISIPPALMQMVPWIPFAFEAISGQKVPQMSGTMAEIQSAIQQMQFSLTQILNNQQQLWSKLESLENNASSQLTNLSQQVARANKSFHLLATETKRSLEFNPQPKEPEY